MIKVSVDGKKIDLEEGASAFDLAHHLKLTAPDQALGASINGTDRDLSTPLSDGDAVVFWSFNDPKGREIFWHTSAHLLAQAVLRLWPEAKLTIGPPIQNGFYYDFANLTVSEEDFDAIEKEMKKIVKENPRPKRCELKSREEALSHFGENPYKSELIQEIPKQERLTAYQQGEFFDLCRGPHLSSLGKIKALKLLKTSGAYWRGDAKREMLTRIYGITFPTKEQLDAYVHQVEEAKKRDHKILGPALDLYSIKEEAPGMPFIHPKGLYIWNQLIEYMRSLHRVRGYVEIKTPVMMTRELWERSGHWANYRDNMYTSQIEERVYAIKPMNCPGCMLYYKEGSHSYRQLPMRVAEFGHVHRYEAHGALSGLFRVRGFHQDDAHIFMRPSQLQGEISSLLSLCDELYTAFGLSYRVELSTRPEGKTIGSDEAWDFATKALKEALESSQRAFKINEGDGAFYGPKIDIHLEDALGRSWQCGTIQLDMALPERFDLEYTEEDGSRQRPIMIHRALCGSLERFLGQLIEHFAGKFPLWLSPRQVRIITVADRHAPYAHALAQRLSNFEVEVDDSNESVSKKIRSAQLMQVNYILTVGDQEVESGTVALRTRDNVVHGTISIESFIENISIERMMRSLTSAYVCS
ncbi:MAG: threonine--tRNA ligase [Verrucomicrobia bacterium]|nr:threonine--tRNA ligase [Verrucomicrobiota bacterium]